MVILFLVCLLSDSPPHSLLKEFHDGDTDVSVHSGWSSPFRLSRHCDCGYSTISSAIGCAISPAGEQTHPWLTSAFTAHNLWTSWYSQLSRLWVKTTGQRNIQLLLACLSTQMSEARLIRERRVIHYVWTEYHPNMLQQQLIWHRGSCQSGSHPGVELLPLFKSTGIWPLAAAGARINPECCWVCSSALHATCSLPASSLTSSNCSGCFGLVYTAQGKWENAHLSTRGSSA